MSDLLTLTSAVDHPPHVGLLSARGILNGATYRTLRDGIVKAALDAPRAVVIDVSALTVDPPSAWSVFTTARWLVSVWPDVPIILVCDHQTGRDAIVHNGVARCVPVFPDADGATAAAAMRSSSGSRRHARTSLQRNKEGRTEARQFTAETLTAWHCQELVPVACTVAWVLVDNVLAHTASTPVITVEEMAGDVTIAVADGSTSPAVRHENPTGGTDIVSGLSIVSALTRRWGSLPTGAGKTVWAVIGPENRL